MSIALRLSRGGSKKRPYYKVVAADSRSSRDGKYLEQLGTYNPLLAKDDEARVKLIEDRVRYWLGVGAQPSDRVARMLDKAGIQERIATNNPTKAEPGKKAKDRAEDKAKKLAEAEEAKAAAAAAPPVEEAPVEEAALVEEAAVEAPADAAAAEAPAAEAAPADEAAPAAADVPATEAPAAEEVPAAEEAPAAADESAAETPAVEKAPAAEETNEVTPNSDAGDDAAKASGESAQEPAEG